MNADWYNAGKETLVILIGEEAIDYASFPDGSFLVVSDFNWNDMLSPWHADPVFRKGEAFGGKADCFLAEILTLFDAEEYKHILIAGYSLAGLFALYACQNSEVFDGCASVSGSLWFPGWLEYLKTHPVHAQYVYFSLGEKEKDSRNPLLASVETCTEEAFHLVQDYAKACFELNEGGHFGPAKERMEQAVSILLAGIKEIR